jgi:hypothetical protein
MRKFGAVDDHQHVGPQVDDSLGRIANAPKNGCQLYEKSYAGNWVMTV